MKKKLLALLMATTMTVGLLAGCSSSNDETTGGTVDADTVAADVDAEPVTLLVWAPEVQISSGAIDAMCESFQAAHPEWDITFTVEPQGEDKLKDIVLQDPTAAADVYFCANDQVAELAAAGALAKLGGSTEEMVKSTMDATVVDTVTVDGSIYAIPFTHNTYFMYYDKTLLSEEDITSVENILAAETGDDVYNFLFQSAGGWKLASWYYAAGCTIYGQDGVTFSDGCDWNNETGVAVSKYLIDLINNAKCAYNDDDVDNDVSITEAIAEHKLGAWFSGAWDYPLFKDILGDDLGLAIIPSYNLDGTDYQLKGFYGSKDIGVNPNAAYPEVAVAFAAYLGSEEMQLLRFEMTGEVPTNKALSSSEAIQADEAAIVIMDEVAEASVVQPSSSEFSSRYWSNVTGIAPGIRSGEINKDNVQASLDAFCAKMVVE